MSRNGDLGHLEGDITTVADDVCADLEQLLLQAGQRPVPDRLGRCQGAQEVGLSGILCAEPEQNTLPRQMLSGIRELISPTITAAASVLIVFSTAMLLAVEMLRRRSERLRGIKN